MAGGGLRIRASTVGALLLPVAVALRFVPGPVSGLSYVALGCYALFGPTQAIEALGMSWFITAVNPGLAGMTSFSVGRFVVIAAAATSVFARSIRPGWRTTVSKPVFATALVGAFLVVHSVLFSKMTDVSILKSVSWVLAACTLLSAWGGLTQEDAQRLQNRVFRGLMGVLLLSMPLLFFPVGYLANGSGFQGLLNQPQEFGVIAGLTGSWAAARVLAHSRPPWREVVMIGVCFALIAFSEARTAALGMVLGYFCAFAYFAVLSGQSAGSVLPGLKSVRFYVVAAVVVLLVLFAWPMMTNQLSGFIMKRGHAQSVTEAYGVSRGGLVGDMLSNIRAEPLSGIGFGVASRSERRTVSRDAVLGLPISAAGEKGVAPVAVVEELGALGFAVVGVWLWMIGRRVARNGMEALTVFSVILAINLGESSFFSAGGTGILTLILIAWAARHFRPMRDDERL